MFSWLPENVSTFGQDIDSLLPDSLHYWILVRPERRHSYYVLIAIISLVIVVVLALALFPDFVLNTR